MQKKENDHFIGLWRHPVGGWEIKYQLSGKKISEYRKDHNEARLRAEYWKSTLDGPPKDSGEEHPVIYWERMLRRIAEVAIANPSDRDVSATCRALASAAQAAIRTAKYLPAPRQASPDDSPVSGDISNMTTEEMERLLGDPNPSSKGE